MVEQYKPLYTIKEASKVLVTSLGFVYREIENGNIPALKIGSLKIRGSDLENYIVQANPVSSREDKQCIKQDT